MQAKVSSSNHKHRSELITDSHGTPYYVLTHKVLPALLLLCCCWLVFYITSKGLANAYYFKANYYLGLWQRKPQTLMLESWQQAADAIQTAVKYHPKHPHYLLTQAKINEWAWYGRFKTADKIEVNDQLYKKAIQLRPGWPNAYADYAYYLGVINFRITEAFEELANAKQVGPYMPETFQRTLVVAATHWPLLNAVQKNQGFHAMEHMVTNSLTTYRQALQISQQHHLQRQFCIYLKVKKAMLKPSTNKMIKRDFCTNPA
ncbi:hypothetical protein [Rheinheimera sp. 1928-s]|uniref:hypothetical protein n=1 Tax=Rheinheimera sp. 1928-s TaxID=3033803 RepID=UPI002623ACE6|nr:hypothetical protein [Rheinheimera sp. 1928-s]MDF3125694.1 hypothetical protein [Rheinheimera sp. 1928-s]